MKALHLLEEYDLKIIESFINNEIEESVNIEFKASGSISKQPSVKKEMSKDISSFANSDGGIIIYGVEEKNHKAHSLSTINGNVYTKEFLEQVINSTIKRTIKNLKIFPIRVDGDIGKSIYVVQIPSSVDAPHMSQDKRFHRRHNFESAIMEEYEVRQLYGRKIKADLCLHSMLISITHDDGEEDETRFKFILSIKNIGEILVKDYRANLYYEGDLKFCKINWEALGQGKHYSYTHLTPEVQITNENPIIIYPSEILDVLNINFDVKTEHLESFIRNLKLRGKVFYDDRHSEKIYDKQESILRDYLGKKEEFTFLEQSSADNL